MTDTAPKPMRAEYRFGLVFLLLLATFFVLATGATGKWTRPVTVALQGATLLAALYAAGMHRRIRHAALVVVVVAFIASFATIPLESEGTAWSSALLNFMLVAFAPVAI